ncbi:hypothetical protein GCM10023148_33920 [Actinokineospora soli]
MSDTEYASRQSVAGLAREVEGLRRAWRPIPQRLDDLAKVVDGLAETAAHRTGAGQKVVAPSWFNLPDDLDKVAALIDELCGWVGTVFLRYPDAAAVLSDCWLWHPEVIEELVWLMHTWIAAYADEAASAVAAGDWHSRAAVACSSATSCAQASHSARWRSNAARSSSGMALRA